MPSQLSVCGELLHALNPPLGVQPPGCATATGGLQVSVPAQFAGVARPHGAARDTPSSATLSRSSSQPLHSSGLATLPLQTLPSSTRPSQSSSTELQASFAGQCSGEP